MDSQEALTAEEKSRVEAVLRTCFNDVNDFNEDFSYKVVVVSDNKSFWSKIVRVMLEWRNEQLAQDHPKSIFMKIPRISDNVKALDKKTDAEPDDRRAAEVLALITKYEVSWYQCYGHDNIPHFPMPKYYGAEDVTQPGEGILALEDLTDRVKTMDLFPGFSLTQVERIMDALAGFHYHFISKEDQSWVAHFDRAADVEHEFQELQFNTCCMFEKIRPDLFKGRISALKENFSIESAVAAHYSYEELGVPPVLVHYDMNPTNLLWDKERKKLVAVIDFQLLHTGNFAEDIARILMLTMSRQQRRKYTNALLERYHDTLSSLFDGNPPYTLSKVHEAYDRIYLYAFNFALFAMATYYGMYENLEKDEAKRAKIQEEIVDRAYGVVVDAERPARLRQNRQNARRV